MACKYSGIPESRWRRPAPGVAMRTSEGRMRACPAVMQMLSRLPPMGLLDFDGLHARLRLYMLLAQGILLLCCRRKVSTARRKLSTTTA